jgi:hypothetical protein
VTLDGVNSNYYFALDKDLYNSNPHQSIGWYQIDSLPKTGADSFNLSNDLVPAVIYGDLVTDPETGKIHRTVEKYNDTIDWVYCTMRNENGEDSTAYVGMRIPAPVVEFEAESVDAYYGRNDGGGTNVFTNINLIDKCETALDGTDMASHPFYTKWNIKIPRGIKGESIQGIYVIPASESIVALVLTEDGLVARDANGGVITNAYQGQDDDIANNREIIVYHYIDYDRVPTGEHYLVYLGDYNQIDNFTIDEQGTVVIDYSHDDTDTYSKLIDWVKDIEFNDDGTIAITMNNDSLFDNGVLSKPQLINWLTSLTLDPDTGAFKTTFNNANIPAIDTTLQWVKDIAIADDGTITFDYTNIEDKVLSQRLNWIKAMTFNNDTGALSITFNNSNISNISHTLNYVKSFERDANDHLIITHSDPTKGRQDLGSISYMVAAPAENEAVRNLATDGIWVITKEYNPQNNG